MIKEGDNPVGESVNEAIVCVTSSITEHEKFRENQPGPSGKAKYYLMTDSAQVP